MSKKKIHHFTFFGLQFTLDVKTWFKYTLMVWAFLLLFFLTSINFFGYELTDSDVPCSIIFGGLVGYLIYVLLE